jgi:hypothetical protein
VRWSPTGGRRPPQDAVLRGLAESCVVDRISPTTPPYETGSTLCAIKDIYSNRFVGYYIESWMRHTRRSQRRGA